MIIGIKLSVPMGLLYLLRSHYTQIKGTTVTMSRNGFLNHRNNYTERLNSSEIPLARVLRFSSMIHLTSSARWLIQLWPSSVHVRPGLLRPF